MGSAASAFQRVLVMSLLSKVILCGPSEMTNSEPRDKLSSNQGDMGAGLACYGQHGIVIAALAVMAGPDECVLEDSAAGWRTECS